MPNRDARAARLCELTQSLSSQAKKAALTEEISHEIGALDKAVNEFRTELSGAHPGSITAHLPAATDDLEAIIDMTEKATHDIMSACEVIQACIDAGEASWPVSIRTQVTRIMEACTFQDLTGQRIGRTIKALRQIDGCAARLTGILHDRFDDLEEAIMEPEKSADEKLLNGPQNTDSAISQDEVNRLFD